MLKTIQAITLKALTLSLIQPSPPSGFGKFTSYFTLWRTGVLVSMCLAAPNALHAIANNPIVDIIQRWTDVATEANTMTASGLTDQNDFVQDDLNYFIELIDTAIAQQWSDSKREEHSIPFTDLQLNHLKAGLSSILLCVL